MRSFKEYSVKDLTVVDYTPGMGKEISYNAQKRKRKDYEESKGVDELSLPTPKTGLSKAATGAIDKDKLKKDLERLKKGVNEVSSNTLSNYMRKSAADAAKPGASARRQDKRIGGQSMADKKIRKKMGYSSTAKVPAGTNEDDASARMYRDNPDMMKQQGPGGFKSLDPKMQKTIKKAMKKLPPKPTKEAHDSEGIKAMKKAGNAKADAERKEKQEGSARDRLLKMMNKASGRNDADRQKDADAATARRKEAERDHAEFQRKMRMKEDVDVEVEEENTDEALTMQARLKKRRQMKRLKSRIKLGRERAKRKMADPERLKKRARKQARNQILKKLTKGMDKSELTFARRQELEKRLDKPAVKSRIDRIAKKMLPKVRRQELDRRRGGGSDKK